MIFRSSGTAHGSEESGSYTISTGSSSQVVNESELQSIHSKVEGSINEWKMSASASLSETYQVQISSCADQSYSTSTVTKSYTYNLGERTGLYIITLAVYNKYEELLYSQQGGQLWQYSTPDIDQTHYMIPEDEVYAEEVPEGPVLAAIPKLAESFDLAEKRDHLVRPQEAHKKGQHFSTVTAVSAAALLAVGAGIGVAMRGKFQASAPEDDVYESLM